MDHQEGQAVTLFYGLKLKDRFLHRGDFSSVLLFEIIFIYFMFLWLTYVFIVLHGLSLVAGSGGHSSWWCMGLLLFRRTGSRCVGLGLSSRSM